MKLWQKDKDSLQAVTDFTAGQDRVLDMRLARYDVLGSLAHITMLQSIKLLTTEEHQVLAEALRKLYKDIEAGNFVIEPGVEDVHSQVELLLTRQLGDIGKKIHSGRSRNDQVLVDLKLLFRAEIESLVHQVHDLFELLLSLSETHRHHLLPGYTHLQLAMPSSFGLWFGAYAESLADDVMVLQGAYRMADRNPLGSAAGYGSSFPLNRTMTTALLGFEDLHYNVVYAQMGRGKTERIVASAMANVAATLARLSMDACLFLNQQFGFISFPEELTTGSSIMPHKKNPDVFELVRARCNSLAALPNEITMLTTNLPSGYHRDMQVLKEKIFPAFTSLKECLSMVQLMLSHVEVKENILDHPSYQYVFSVEEVNKLVLNGIPFRDAYRMVGKQIADNTFKASAKVNHTHEGSIGNLSNDLIRQRMEAHLASFGFARAHAAISGLLRS